MPGVEREPSIVHKIALPVPLPKELSSPSVKGAMAKSLDLLYDDSFLPFLFLLKLINEVLEESLEKTSLLQQLCSLQPSMVPTLLRSCRDPLRPKEWQFLQGRSMTLLTSNKWDDDCWCLHNLGLPGPMMLLSTPATPSHSQSTDSLSSSSPFSMLSCALVFRISLEQCEFSNITLHWSLCFPNCSSQCPPLFGIRCLQENWWGPCPIWIFKMTLYIYL